MLKKTHNKVIRAINIRYRLGNPFQSRMFLFRMPSTMLKHAEFIVESLCIKLRPSYPQSHIQTSSFFIYIYLMIRKSLTPDLKFSKYKNLF